MFFLWYFIVGLILFLIIFINNKKIYSNLSITDIDEYIIEPLNIFKENSLIKNTFSLIMIIISPIYFILLFISVYFEPDNSETSDKNKEIDDLIYNINSSLDED